jgi:hypothetical protein
MQGRDANKKLQVCVLSGLLLHAWLQRNPVTRPCVHAGSNLSGHLSALQPLMPAQWHHPWTRVFLLALSPNTCTVPALFVPQRAIRAGKLRDKLPSMVEELRGLLAEWKDCEGEVSEQAGSFRS